jgi:hypothetical protein
VNAGPRWSGYVDSIEELTVHLEKATSRSSEAALAGWISSNDVTLFTTVLVVMVAIFLHARMSQGARQNVQISQEKDSLAARLASTLHRGKRHAKRFRSNVRTRTSAGFGKCCALVAVK